MKSGDNNGRRRGYERLPDGTEREWHRNGQLAEEKLPDGTNRCRYEDGRPEEYASPDGVTIKWGPNGELTSMKNATEAESAEIYRNMLEC